MAYASPEMCEQVVDAIAELIPASEQRFVQAEFGQRLTVDGVQRPAVQGAYELDWHNQDLPYSETVPQMWRAEITEPYTTTNRRGEAEPTIHRATVIPEDIGFDNRTKHASLFTRGLDIYGAGESQDDAMGWTVVNTTAGGELAIVANELAFTAVERRRAVALSTGHIALDSKEERAKLQTPMYGSAAQTYRDLAHRGSFRLTEAGGNHLLKVIGAIHETIAENPDLIPEEHYEDFLAVHGLKHARLALVARR